MARWMLSILLIVLALGTASSNLARTPFQSEATGPDEIHLYLSVDKSVFVVGRPVQVNAELQNAGANPVLVENALITGTGFSSSIKFVLSDSKGNLSPATVMIADSFSMPKKSDPLTAVIGAWMLLLPHYCLMHQFSIDAEDFSFLAKPGRYRLWANYSSVGLNDPSTYRRLGLSSEDVESLKYKSWTGKVRSNEVSIVVAGSKN